MERERLEALLDRIGQGDEVAQQLLLDHIMVQPEGIRILAFEALRDGGEATREQLLLTLADDPELVARPRVRRGGEPLPADAPLSDYHPIAQQAGREWQAQVGGTPPPPALVQQLQGAGERSARVQAAQAMSDYPSPQSVALLRDAIRSGDGRVAAAAVEALQRLGPLAVSAMIELLGESDTQQRWHAAKVLSAIADERAVPALVRALEDSNYGTRWLAAEAMARLGRAAIVPLLRRLAEQKGSAWLRQGIWHTFNKLALNDEAQRGYFKELGERIKKSSAAVLPDLARQELRRLGEEA